MNESEERATDIGQQPFDKVVEHLKELLTGKEVASPEWAAALDIQREYELENRINRTVLGLNDTKIKKDAFGIANANSDLTIDRLELAGLRNAMHERKVHMSGYTSAIENLHRALGPIQIEKRPDAINVAITPERSD